MVLTYETGTVSTSTRKQDICLFCCSQSTDDKAELSFELYSEEGALYSVALDGSTVVGSSLNVPADSNQRLLGIEGLSTWLSDNNYDINTLLYPAMIHVDPAYSGQNIGNQLSISKSTACQSSGFTDTILFGYETQAIFDYSTKIGSLVDTGIDDWKGFRIYLRSLNDVISQLS
jgi:hypothetical protein